MTSPEAGKPTRIHTETAGNKPKPEIGFGHLATAIIVFTAIGAFGWRENAAEIAAKQNERNQKLADELTAAEEKAIAEQKAAGEPVEGASSALKAKIVKRIMK